MKKYLPKVLRIALVVNFTVLLMVTSARAQEISNDSFKPYQSSFLQLVTADSIYANEEQKNYPFWAKILYVESFRYNPVIITEDLEDACSVNKWQDSLRGTSEFTQLADAVSNYFLNCGNKIRVNWNNFISNTYLTMMLKLEPKHHPYAREVMLNLPNGVKLKGLLALKGDNKKRPLILLRLGIFSSVSEFFPERFLFMQLFEESPFNMLILESNSGGEFVFRNKQIAIGGYDEGIANFQVARALQKSSEPLSQIIDGVHMVGFSFGGHGAMFATLLSSLNSTPVFRSTLALCPLINFAETRDYHRSHGFGFSSAEGYVSERMRGVEKVIPGIDPDHVLDSVFKYLDNDYAGARSLDDSVPLPAEIRAMPPNKFWQRNQFWPFYKNIKAPVLILASVHDPIVPYEVNSQRLLDKDIDLGDSNLRVIPLPEGLHCTIPGAYEWRPFTALIQTYLLQQSGYHPQKITHRVLLDEGDLGVIANHGFDPDFEIVASKDPTQVELVVSFHRQIKRISFAWLDTGYAQSKFMPAKELLNRWARQNIRLSVVEDENQKSYMQADWSQ